MAAQDERLALVRLIGPPRVSMAGRDREIPAGSRRLLAFVATRPGPLERAYVAGVLWPAHDDARAIGNLRSALWRLRGAGVEVVGATKRSLALTPGTTVDVDLVAAWAARLISGRPRPADLAVFGGCLPGCAGATVADSCALFPGWDDDWALLERERLRQRVLHGLESVVEGLVAQQRLGEAVDVAVQVVAVDPLRESAQRVLITAQLAAGDPTGAARTLRSFGELIRRELGVQPSRRLGDLLARVPMPTMAAMSGDGSWSRSA